MSGIIYLDNAATTFTFNESLEESLSYQRELFYNPSALYAKAVAVSEKLEGFRTHLSALMPLGYSTVFTSGGTEGNCTAIFGAQAANRRRTHFITCETEHPSVYNSFMRLRDMGMEVETIGVNGDGTADMEALKDAVREDTVLVSFMHVNNELGSINDIDAISKLIKAKNKDILFHSDGVQAFGRIRPDTGCVDMYTVSAHKVHGGKGTGAVFIKKGKKILPFLTGGGQEGGMRSGTENIPGISALAVACEEFKKNGITWAETMMKNKMILYGYLQQGLDGIHVNGQEPAKACPHILNVSIEGVRGEVLLHALEKDEVIIGVGSACSSRKREHRVFEACGLSRERAESAVRLSLNPFNTGEEMARAAECIVRNAKELRRFGRR